jgi:hypothetical protein
MIAFIRRRAPRHYFGGPAEVKDLSSKLEVLGATTNLSAFGCFARTKETFPEGTKVAVRITRCGVTFESFGEVTHVQSGKGMGIAFASIEAQSQTILEKWIAESASCSGKTQLAAFPLWRL